MRTPLGTATPFSTVQTSFSLTKDFQRTWTLMRVLVVNEVRLRTRRLSTLFAVFGIMALSWSMIVDPATGTSLIVINQARVLYTSSALAMGSAGLLSFLMALIGFYLVRGRMSEDIRSGIGGVIASTCVSNKLFLFSRWLGGVAYLMLLGLAAMLSMLTLQGLRGEETIQIGVYLQTYSLVLMPMIFFAVSVAILFDSLPFLMGKAGDVIYFVLWVVQISLIAKLAESSKGSIPGWFLLDFSGMVTTASLLRNYFGVDNFSLGASEFNPLLTPITLPDSLWHLRIIAMRLLTAAMAIVPLVPAFFLFHRFSPDRVKASHSRKRRSPIEILNGWTRPLAKQVHPLFTWASKSPNFFGQTISELALSLVNSPFAIAVIAAALFVSSLANLSSLQGLLLPIIAYWGILISDISSRDFQAGILPMTGVIQGGAHRRYWRQFAASVFLGLLFVGVILLRLGFASPLLALALGVGVLSLAALANLLGAITNTPRTFLVAFMSWLYVASQSVQTPLLDAVGFNGVSDTMSILAHGGIGACALALGHGLTYRVR